MIQYESNTMCIFTTTLLYLSCLMSCSKDKSSNIRYVIKLKKQVNE